MPRNYIAAPFAALTVEHTFPTDVLTSFGLVSPQVAVPESAPPLGIFREINSFTIPVGVTAHASGENAEFFNTDPPIVFLNLTIGGRLVFSSSVETSVLIEQIGNETGLTAKWIGNLAANLSSPLGIEHGETLSLVAGVLMHSNAALSAARTQTVTLFTNAQYIGEGFVAAQGTFSYDE